MARAAPATCYLRKATTERKPSDTPVSHYCLDRLHGKKLKPCLQLALAQTGRELE